MYKNTQEIFDYLPIEAGSENLYIQHLSGAFQAVNEKDEPIKAFSILPFHLLFMLAVQYRVYRISAFKKNEYLDKLKTCWLYDNGHRMVLENNPPIADKNGNISSICSVRNISLIPEKRIFDFFRIIGTKDKIIARAKELVEIRGTYAHANGNIEENIDARIEEYFWILKEIQNCMREVNIGVQNWANEIEEGEFPLDDFFRERFLQSQFSSCDFGDIIGTLLKAKRIDSDQWIQIVDTGLELANNQTIVALHDYAKNGPDKNKRIKAKYILRENGEI